MIPFASFEKMHSELRSDLDMSYKRVLNSNYFIQGKNVKILKKNLLSIVV